MMTVSYKVNPEVNVRSLHRENLAFRGSGGTSSECSCRGFTPAFLDRETNTVYPACYANGLPAPIHILDGLPAELVIARDSSGRVQAVKQSILSGFVRDGVFYTREQVADLTS